MLPDYFEEIIKHKKFDNSIKGYNPNQVDRYLKKMISYYRNVCTKKEELENEISQYVEQDRYLRKALLRLEETSEEIKREALLEAENIKQQAKDEAEQIKQEAIKDVKLIKVEAMQERERFIQNHLINRQLYEEQTKELIGNLYYTVRSKFKSLQEDLFTELENYIKSLERKEMNIHSMEKVNKENAKQDSLGDYWKLKEEELLVGCKIKDDIIDSEGNVIIPKSTIVIPEIIQLLIEKELYGELVTAIDYEDNEYCK